MSSPPMMFLFPVILAAVASLGASPSEPDSGAVVGAAPAVRQKVVGGGPPELRVSGTTLVADGREVWLQGVSVPSLEWKVEGDHVLASIRVAIEDWGANCIRLPVSGTFWAGRGPGQTDGGTAYRRLVEEAVTLCAAHGAYLVLDLHGFRAPDDTDVAFWQSAGERFKNHPAVLFDLFNEPYAISWETWRDGGPVTDVDGDGKVPAENRERRQGFSSVGLQRLLDTVRGLGARNVVLVGGLDWGYDVSGVTEGFALEDRGGNGIVYSTHVYPWKRNWTENFLSLAGKYPLIIGEMGADEKPMPFERPEAREDPADWTRNLLGLAQRQRIHWLAWCFHPEATPRLIADWSYTPTPFFGVPVKQALAGKAFVPNTLR